MPENTTNKTATDQQTKPVRLEFENNKLLLELCGHHDGNLQQIEESLGIQIITKGNQLAIFGQLEQSEKAKVVLEDLYELIESGITITSSQVDAALRVTDGLIHSRLRPGDVMGESGIITTPRKKIIPRSVQQHVYINALRMANLVFGVGPAGTGKTYLAAAMAVQLLMSRKVERLILTRPVVEAGETLGFLPGTLEEKIDPYLRPLFDALNETLGFEKTKELMEAGVIEVAPLAYMRGRTINNAVMLLDEAQNTTSTQMKMFLTRMGENSHMFITGDPTQIDLKRGQQSGLKDAVNVLEGLRDIEVVRFADQDVVRHALVARIVQAYEERDKQLTINLEK